MKKKDQVIRTKHGIIKRSGYRSKPLKISVEIRADYYGPSETAKVAHFQAFGEQLQNLMEKYEISSISNVHWIKEFKKK